MFLSSNLRKVGGPLVFWHLRFNAEGVLASNLRKVEQPLGHVALVCAVFFCQRRFCFNPLLGPKPLGFFGICVLTPRVFWLQIIVRSKSPLGVLHLFVQFFFAKGVFVSILC